MKNNKKILSILSSIIIIVFFPIMSICQDNKNYFFGYENNNSWTEWNENWEENKMDENLICLTPGNDESIINFSWYSKESTKLNKLKVYDDEKNEQIINANSTSMKHGLVSNKVVVKNLKPNTTYYYSYTIDGNWTNPVAFETKSKHNFSFVFMGDPQIGASYKYKSRNSYEESIKEDSYNWNKVIKKSLEKRNNISFIVCGGDETNTNANKSEEHSLISNLEYRGFLYPDYLRFIPIANTIGNHDKENNEYYYRFNMPNLSELGKTDAGGDYYFSYNDALFIILNTNNLNINEHKKVIEESINNNQNKKWRIVVFHHDIYGGGEHYGDKDVIELRKKLPPILEENDVDLVLSGHDHIYSRSNLLLDDKVSEKGTINKLNEGKDSIEIYRNPKGILYITGGSSTGSKFYKNNNDDNNLIKFRYDKKEPMYTIIDVDNNFIQINTYKVNDEKNIDNSIVISK